MPYLLMKSKEWVKIVKKANTGVRRHGIMATVLSKMGSAKEEGSDVLGVMMPGPRVAWVMEQAHREEIPQEMNRDEPCVRAY